MGSKYRLRENDFVIYILLITYTLNGPDKTYVWRQRNVRNVNLNQFTACADSEGGGGIRNSPPPLRFVTSGVLCGCLMGRRGDRKVALSYYYIFFLVRFARQQYTWSKCLKKNIYNGNIFPSLNPAKIFQFISR